MLTYNNNFVPLAQLKTINMPRQARKTSGLNNGHQLRDYSKSSNRSESPDPGVILSLGEKLSP